MTESAERGVGGSHVLCAVSSKVGGIVPSAGQWLRRFPYLPYQKDKPPIGLQIPLAEG